MLGKITAGLLIMATASFGMSLTELNKASKDELMQINGIGEVKAASIIKERRKGKFKSFDGLSERVDGVGEQIASNVKNDIKVGETPKAVSKKTTRKTKNVKSKADDTKSKMSDKTSNMDSKTSKSKSKADTKIKETTKKKDRKIKSIDDKKKELKKKSRKTKNKTKTKTKSSKKKRKSKKTN